MQNIHFINNFDDCFNIQADEEKEAKSTMLGAMQQHVKSFRCDLC